jgi:phosphate-selective porin OprO and OprP
VEAGWTVTGETRSYNAGNAAYTGIVPENPFGFGGLGAWEIPGGRINPVAMRNF